MSKLENKLFSELTNKAGFYIKDYYSEYLKKNKWIAIMEKEEFIYAVIVCKDNESDFIYNESINFLSKLYLKSISLNIVISSVEDYDNLIQKNYNKVIYSEKEKQVVYSDSSCKPLVSIINYSKEDEKYSKKFKDNIVTNLLVGINILIYILTVVVSKSIYNIDSYTLVEFGAKMNYLINNGQPWRLITCAFLHGGLAHIGINMYSLKVIGEEVEYAYGKARYIIIYLVSSLGGSLFSYLFNPESISVGASGAIFGLLGAMIAFGIKHKDRIGKEYVINLFKVVVINIIIGVTLSNIDNSSHIGGIIFGFLIALILGNKKLY